MHEKKRIYLAENISERLIMLMDCDWGASPSSVYSRSRCISSADSWILDSVPLFRSDRVVGFWRRMCLSLQRNAIWHIERAHVNVDCQKNTHTKQLREILLAPREKNGVCFSSLLHTANSLFLVSDDVIILLSECALACLLAGCINEEEQRSVMSKSICRYRPVAACESPA